MICTILMCCALLGPERGETGPPVGALADQTTYESAKKKARHDAGAHVRLALWCESHGLAAERMKHLALAVLYDPSNALARGLMGLVAYRDKWGTPETVGQQIQADPAYREVIREYLERRAKSPNKPDAQLRLAAWCEEKGLKAQALIHYKGVLVLDPTREAAWRHLGYKKQGNRWVKSDAAATEKVDAERQKRADKQWKPKLERMRDDLESKDASRRAKAAQALAEVTDPRAVPMVWAVFVRGSERSQNAAVQIFGQIDSPAASGSLATLALFCPRDEARGRATATLTRRDPRDVVGQLIGLVRKPFKYQVRPVGGPGSTGVLFVEGERFNVQRIYQSIPINPSLIPARLFDPSVAMNLANLQQIAMVSADPFVPRAGATATGGALPDDLEAGPLFPGNLTIDPAIYLADLAAASAGSAAERASATRLREIGQANLSLQQSLAMDIQALESVNSQISQLNDRALPVLKRMTGQDLGAEPNKWKGWWTDQLGYAFQAARSQPNPTLTQFVSAQDYLPSSSCFGAGTLVSTVEGPRAIESIQVGQRVLSQNTTTGRLTFEPVVATHRNQPAPTLRIDIGGETVVSTGIHRFWKADKGWTMARELKTGDRLRVVGGTALVRAIEPAGTQPVYNLDVAENRDFFVGTKGFLVHDFSFVQPVSSPFDRSSP
jgi:tetratricopeptide (TPR) repeat protein